VWKYHGCRLKYLSYWYNFYLILIAVPLKILMKGAECREPVKAKALLYL